MPVKQRKLDNKLPKRIQPVAAPRKIARVGRNEPCPCGSGKKFKDCHQAEGDAYLQRLAADQEKERVRAQLAAEGKSLPWYRRLFGV